LYLFPDVNLTLEISNVSAGAEEKQLAELEFLTRLHFTTPAACSERGSGFRKPNVISGLLGQQVY
jgi:hypothetical protein